MATEKLPAGFDPLSAEPQSPQMGALGQIVQNAGRNQKDEDLAFASGILAPSSNGTSGALGNAYTAQSKYRLERDQLQAQYVPLILQSMAAQFQREALGKFFGDSPMPGAAGASTAADAAPAAGASPAGMGGPPAAPGGAQAAPGAQPAAMPSSQNPGSKLASYNIDQITAFDKLTGMNMMDPWKIAKEGFERHPGSFYDIPGVGQMYQPDPTKGIGFANGKVYQLDNAGKVIGELAQATALGTKTAEAQTTPLPPTFVATGTGKPIGGSTADYLGLGKPATAPASGAPGAVPAAPTGGKAATGADADQARILSAELDKYLGQIHQLDPKTTDPAVLKAANDDLQGVVKEMKRAKVVYIPEALRSVPLGAVTPDAVAQAGTPALQGPAEAAGQKMSSEEAAKAGQTYQNTLHDKVEADFQLVQRNKQISPLLDKYNSGGIAPDERLHVGNALATSGAMQSLFGKDNAKKFGDAIAGGDVTAGKALENQLAAAGISTLLQTLDKEGKPNRAEFQVMNDARESLKSGNATLKDVFDLQKRLYDIHYGEQQALTGAIKSGAYDPRTWAGDYSKIRNDQLNQAPAPLPSAQKYQGFTATLKKG